MVTWRELLADHVGLSAAKQLALADVLGEHSWALDLGSGTIDFGGGRTSAVQVLGSESDRDDTWLWGWANSSLDVPLVAAAGQVRKIGERLGVDLLTEPQSPLPAARGHELALVACGLLHAEGYYRCPYEGGAAYVLLSGTPLPPVPSMDTPRFVTLGTQLTGFDVDHRRAVAALLRDTGLGDLPDGDRVQVPTPDGQELVIAFVHVRLGARVVKVCPVSMTIPGTPAQWREWTGLPLDASGPIDVPGGLTPVHVSVEHDHAVYVEPNVWVRHRAG